MPKIFSPQPGPQEKFLASPADICIYGGSAGGGKSFALLLAAIRYKSVYGYGATIFRRNFNQVFAQGGLWDESIKMYGNIRGASNSQIKGQWTFKDRDGKPVSKITFAHLEREDDVLKWQGTQICGLCFDELTHFSEKTFFYMLSRNRSTCGVVPYVKATCNPDADSWVAKFIEWWIDQDTGYPIQERGGVMRYFIRRGETIYWADTKKELWERFELKTKEEKAEPKSVTFIPSSIYDNKALLTANPEYLSNLKSLATVERERLLNGNWKIMNRAGLMFKRGQVDLISSADVKKDEIVNVCRAWDLAATAEDEGGEAAYTASVLMGVTKGNQYVILDVINQRLTAGDAMDLVRNTAKADRQKYQYIRTRVPQDPGQAGKAQAAAYIRYMAGLDIVARPESGDKVTRAMPVAAQWQHGNISVVEAEWNGEYFSQLEGFPEWRFKDMVDATSSVFDELTNYMSFNIANLI